MRRSVLTIALLAACAILAAPAAAQTQEAGWFVAGQIGPSWGTLGDRAAGTISGGYRKDRHMTFALELGMLPPAPADRACSMCDFLCVCGPDQERRGNRKSKKELADLLELRGRP